MLLAEIALKEQDFETARKESSEILALNPKDFRARMLLGNALMAQGRSADAEIAFKTVIAENPENPAGYYRLGLLQRATKDYDGALDSFNAALNLNPMLMDVFTHIVLVHGAKGEFGSPWKSVMPSWKKSVTQRCPGDHPQPQGQPVPGPEEHRCGKEGLWTAIQENPDFHAAVLCPGANLPFRQSAAKGHRPVHGHPRKRPQAGRAAHAAGHDLRYATAI
jgi:tetratricopeptide (TPR) repeat protein